MNTDYGLTHIFGQFTSRENSGINRKSASKAIPPAKLK